MEVSEVIFTAIVTLVGGVLLEAARRWLMRSKEKTDDAAEMRGELRADITRLRDELRQAEEGMDKWRDETYELRDKMLRMKRYVEELLAVIRNRHNLTDEQVQALIDKIIEKVGLID